MARQAREPGQPPESWRGRPVMVCEGGPMAGAWYFADDWTELRRLAVSAGDTPTTGRRLPYAETRRRKDHPAYPAVTGAVWEWRGPKVWATHGPRLP